MAVSSVLALPPADVPGWSAGLEELYTAMVAELPGGAVWVEVGVWLGKSLIYAAREAKRLGKQISFVGVDHFKGSVEHQQEGVVRRGRLYEECRIHLKRYDVVDVVTLLKGESVEAAGAFQDGSVDFVFLDAGHRYEEVRADIEAWLPKVKPGGVLAGHDWHGWPDVQVACRSFGGVEVVGDCWVYRKEKRQVEATAIGTAWEYKTVLAPVGCEFAPIAAVIDKLGLEGWEYVDHLDLEVPVPEVPQDLRGQDIAGRQAQSGNGAMDLIAGALARSQRKMLAHHLIFKRKKTESFTLEGVREFCGIAGAEETPA